MSLVNKDYSPDTAFSPEEDIQSGGARTNKTIFEQLFVFDPPYRNDIMNVLQYSFISLIPLVLLNKLIQYAIPDACSSSGSVEIVMEIIGQISMLVIGLILVHRFTIYFTTYSGEPYPQHSIICFVLGLLIVLISIHSKLGEKINILVERVVAKWNGRPPEEHRSAHKKHKRSHHHIPDVQVMDRPTHPREQDTTQISNLPIISQSSNNQPVQHSSNDRTYGQAAQAYSLSYDMPSNGAPMDGGMISNEPSAANSVLGGSFGSVW
jgi:hypothetical protein